MENEHERIGAIRAAVNLVCRGQSFAGKCGESDLKPAIATSLESLGFDVDTRDKKKFLRTGMHVWRDNETRNVILTRGRRLIELVIYSEERPIALIEAESDLNDLVNFGVKRRNDHYDVASIGCTANGEYFNSYKSLERMAAAAFYFYRYKTDGTYPDPITGLAALSALRSNNPTVHNPLRLPLLLVAGTCRTGLPIDDRKLLEPRLKSLGAELIVAG
jgi:hypothetical protein